MLARNKSRLLGTVGFLHRTQKAKSDLCTHVVDSLDDHAIDKHVVSHAIYRERTGPLIVPYPLIALVRSHDFQIS